MVREGVSHRRGQRHVVYVVCYLKLGVGCHVRYVCMSRHCFRHCFSMRGRRVGCSELLFCGKGKRETKKHYVGVGPYIVARSDCFFQPICGRIDHATSRGRGLGTGPRGDCPDSGQSESAVADGAKGVEPKPGGGKTRKSSK